MTQESTAEAGKLIAENKKLSDEVAKLKAAAAKMSGASAGEIKTLAAQNRNLAEEIEKLKTAATKMSGDSAGRIRNLTGENKQLSTQIATLTRSVEQVKKLAIDNKRLADEIAKLKADAGKMSAASKRMEALSAENRKLASELSEAKKRVNSISRQLAAARSGDHLKPAASLPELNLPYLVNDPAKLDREAIPLFAELRGIEDDPEARTAAYGEIRKQGKATPLKVVKFDPGSSEVGEDDKTALRNLTDSDDAKFLVVGYASVDGDPDTNARLSSRRASEVAKEIAANGKNKNRVQAVYFGQTNRFSKAYRSPNRIVEVWRIGK